MAPLLVPTLALLALVAIIAIGIGVPASGIFASPVLRGHTTRARVALTFDDGPHRRFTPAILDLLESRGHRGTFFVIGARAEQHEALLADLVRRGHEVANHTWRHSYTTNLMAPPALAAELERTNALVQRVTGVRPRWFRPPVGLLSPRIERAARLAHLELVAWTATARDGVRATTVDDAFARLERALAPGAILVLHDARLSGDDEPIARAVLARLLDVMDARGLKSVTLTECCAPS